MRILQDSTILVMIYLIAGAGLFVAVGLCGQVSINQAVFLGVGAIFSSYFGRSTLDGGLSMPFTTTIILSALCTSFIGVIFAYLTHKMRSDQAISASIASAVLIMYIFEKLEFISGGSRGVSSAKSIEFLGLDFTNLKVGSHIFDPKISLIILYSFFAIIVIFLTFNISRSKLALAFRYMRQRDLAAQVCAINPTKTILQAHLISSFFAGLAGALYAYHLGSIELTSQNPWLGSFGIIVSLQILAFISIGGLRKLKSTLIGAALLVTIGGGVTAFITNLDLVNSKNETLLSTSQINVLVSSVLVLISLHIYSRRASFRSLKSIINKKN